MPELLNNSDVGVACRACGAVRGRRAAPGEAPEDVCDTCWGKFCRWRGRDNRFSEEEFNRWLARKLFLDLRRLDKNGVVGRCEAISNWLYGSRDTHQCALEATMIREGRRVCAMHGEIADRPDYITDGIALEAPYEQLSAIISRLVKDDQKLRATIRAAIGEAEAADSDIAPSLTVNLG